MCSLSHANSEFGSFNVLCPLCHSISTIVWLMVDRGNDMWLCREGLCKLNPTTLVGGAICRKTGIANLGTLWSSFEGHVRNVQVAVVRTFAIVCQFADTHLEAIAVYLLHPNGDSIVGTSSFVGTMVH